MDQKSILLVILKKFLLRVSPYEICGCGIHAIQKNAQETLVATGGDNVTDIGIYNLPDLSPACVFEV